MIGFWTIPIGLYLQCGLYLSHLINMLFKKWRIKKSDITQANMFKTLVCWWCLPIYQGLYLPIYPDYIGYWILVSINQSPHFWWWFGELYLPIYIRDDENPLRESHAQMDWWRYRSWVDQTLNSTWILAGNHSWIVFLELQPQRLVLSLKKTPKNCP